MILDIFIPFVVITNAYILVTSFYFFKRRDMPYMRYRRPSVMFLTVFLSFFIFNLHVLVLEFVDIKIGCPTFGVDAVILFYIHVLV